MHLIMTFYYDIFSAFKINIKVNVFDNIIVDRLERSLKNIFLSTIMPCICA